MSMNIPDHPDITSAMKTGYPSWGQLQPLCCDNCSEELGDEDEVYTDQHHEVLCKECLLRLHTKWW